MVESETCQHTKVFLQGNVGKTLRLRDREKHFFQRSFIKML